MFRKMPFILLIIIVLLFFFSSQIPYAMQSHLYAISLLIKNLIVFLLPFIVFGLLFKTAVHFANRASKIIFFLLLAVVISNFLSTLSSYFVGHLAYQFDLSLQLPSQLNLLQASWQLSFPRWLANDQAMVAGLLGGILCSWLKPHSAKKIAMKIEKVVALALKGILLAVPLFIIGFVIKMNYDQALQAILKNYSLIFVLVTMALMAYITLFYFVASRFSYQATFVHLKNILPAAIAGFGSMSSAAAMPLTILGSEKNAKNKDLARATVPVCVNIHLIGDCFAIPIFAFAVMKSFAAPEPTFISYLLFTVYFVIAKFSVAAVPGGGILVMLPILENYLGFNAEMLSLITALYLLFDPVITGANILGNGGFSLAFDQLAQKPSLSKVEEQEKKSALIDSQLKSF